MHDLALTFLASTVTVGLVILIYVAILSTMKGAVVMVTYASWLDPRTQTWEVVRWDNKKATIVQRNIRTKAKAIEARRLWQERQRLSDMADIVEHNVETLKRGD